MPFFLTRRKFREAVQREAYDPARDPAYLIHRYSENPKLLKRALAASWNVSPEALDRRNVAEASLLIDPMKRAIKAFAEGLQEERAGL